MSEVSEDHVALSTSKVDHHQASPTTPQETAESKLSKKREREVSLEPPTPTVNDAEPIIREKKYSGIPLKKNRRVLEPTEEEDPGTNSVPASPCSSKGFKPSGFMAYASTVSPFASVKGQNIFSNKLAEKDDEYENTDDKGKAKLSEQDVITGEEEEETIHQVRGKLFCLQGTSWKERGTGVLRLNVKQEDGMGARLVMRKDAVYTLLLNIILFPGMRCTLAQDPRYLRFTAIENGSATTYNLKMADAKVAQDLLEEINANIPSS